MNTLSFFNPKFASDFFDVFDHNFCERRENPEMPKRFVPKVDVKETKDSLYEIVNFSNFDWRRSLSFLGTDSVIYIIILIIKNFYLYSYKSNYIYGKHMSS